MDSLLVGLTSEREQKVALIRNYSEAARADSRDLTESEQETMARAKERIGELDKQIGLLADDLEMATEVKDRLRAVSNHVDSGHHYRSAGEIVWDLLHQNDPAAQQRMAYAMKRAAQNMGTEATTTVATAGDLGGLYVAPVRGPIIDIYPRATFATALGLTESPDAMVFMRPRIVDSAFATSSGQQGTGPTLGFEKAELPSNKFDVTAEAVTLTTIGEYLNISQQLISLQAGSLNLITQHMVRRVAYGIDKWLITELIKSTGKVTLALAATAAETVAAIYDASAAVYASTGDLAEWIVMGPLGYARLGGLTDLAGRPLFPTLGPANAVGTVNAANFVGSVAGLNVIVTPAIADEDYWVGNALVLEGYIYRFPVLEAIEPSILGRQVAVAAAVAGYRPVLNGAVLLAP